MICRNYRDGQKLDVSGLNEITVLLDRSESGLTEIGYNKWSPSQDGPPHKHPDKDQIFYVHKGVGEVILGGQKHIVKPGDLAYVPSGLLHQTITTTNEPLSYVLFNVFNDTSKEGHTTFADHIEKVKAVRRAQADSGKSEADGLDSVTNKNTPVFREGVFNPAQPSRSSVKLLSRDQTNRFEFALKHIAASGKEALSTDSGSEVSCFVLGGTGKVTLGGKEHMVREGDLFYIPANTPCEIEALGSGANLLRLTSYL